MSRTLSYTIYNIFTDLTGYSSVSRPREPNIVGYKYMEIPIDRDEEEFEIPCVALNQFGNLVTSNSETKYSKLVVRIYSRNYTPYYRTLNRNLQEILSTNIEGTSLIKTQLNPGVSNSDYYYGCLGSIFDKHLNPLFLCTWKIKRIKTAIENEDNYEFIKPVIRICSDVFTDQSDALQRFLSKKFPILALSSSITPPMLNRNRFINRENPCKPMVIIDNIPFNIKEAEIPSISTENKNLIQIAIDNINEIIEQ